MQRGVFIKKALPYLNLVQGDAFFEKNLLKTSAVLAWGQCGSAATRPADSTAWPV
jgi:hypothetical protein